MKAKQSENEPPEQWSGRFGKSIGGLRNTLSHLFRPYDFFISYAHKDGVNIAIDLDSVLSEKYFRVFRDVEEMGDGIDLSDQVSAALHRSTALILIETDKSLQSNYVFQELKLFKKLGRPIIRLRIKDLLNQNSFEDRHRDLISANIGIDINANANLDFIPDRLDKTIRLFRVLYKWLLGLFALVVLLSVLSVWALFERDSANRGWTSSFTQQLGSLSRIPDTPVNKAVFLAAASYDLALDSEKSRHWDTLARSHVLFDSFVHQQSLDASGNMTSVVQGRSGFYGVYVSNSNGRSAYSLMHVGNTSAAFAKQYSVDSYISAICLFTDETNVEQLVFVQNKNLKTIATSDLASFADSSVKLGMVEKIYCIDNKTIGIKLKHSLTIMNLLSHEITELLYQQEPFEIVAFAANTAIIAKNSKTYLSMVNISTQQESEVPWDVAPTALSQPNALRSFVSTSAVSGKGWLVDNQGRLARFDLAKNEIELINCDIGTGTVFGIAQLQRFERQFIAVVGSNGKLRWFDVTHRDQCRLYEEIQVSEKSTLNVLISSESGLAVVFDGEGKVTHWKPPGSMDRIRQVFPVGYFPVGVSKSHEGKHLINLASPRMQPANYVVSKEAGELEAVEIGKKNNECVFIKSAKWCVGIGQIYSEQQSIQTSSEMVGRNLIRISSDESIVAILNQDEGSISIIDIAQRTEIFFKKIVASKRDLALSKEQPFVAFLYNSSGRGMVNSVALYNYATGEENLFPDVGNLSLTSVGFDKKGGLWYGESGDSMLHPVGQLPAVTSFETGAEGSILDFDFSEDGSWLAVGTTAGVVSLIELETLSTVNNVLPEYSAELSFVQFPWNDNTLVVGSKEGRLALLEVDPQKWANGLCDRSNHLGNEDYRQLGLTSFYEKLEQACKNN